MMSAQSARLLTTCHHTVLRENLCLSSRSGIFAIRSETLRECFVEHVGTDEATIFRTLTLGVGSSEDLESFSGTDIGANLLQVDTVAFEHRLETQDLVRSKIDLVKQQHSATLECLNNRSVMPHSLTIDETKPPIRSSSSVSIVMLTRINSRLV